MGTSAYGAGREAILENLAIPASGLAKAPRRYAGRAMKCAHEIRKIAKADIERDIAD